MYEIGEKIIYGENGVCTVMKIAPLEMVGADPSKMYYYLVPLVGTGTYFTPVDSNAFMRRLISREDAEKLLNSLGEIEPAICNDNRFNHVEAFYKEMFRQHTPEAMVAVIKGINIRLTDKKTKSSRAEITMKRAKDILNGELSIVLEKEIPEIDAYIKELIGA